MNTCPGNIFQCAVPSAPLRLESASSWTN